jgi:hypothetical protein
MFQNKYQQPSATNLGGRFRGRDPHLSTTCCSAYGRATTYGRVASRLGACSPAIDGCDASWGHTPNGPFSTNGGPHDTKCIDSSLAVDVRRGEPQPPGSPGAFRYQEPGNANMDRATTPNITPDTPHLSALPHSPMARTASLPISSDGPYQYCENCHLFLPWVYLLPADGEPQVGPLVTLAR